MGAMLHTGSNTAKNERPIMSIPYTDASYNPVTGCSNQFACREYCWAKKMAARQAGRNGYDKDEPFKPTFHADKLDQPLRWNQPRRIAVSFMGDLFGEGVSEKWVDQVFAVMALCPQHTFLVLTKRPDRMSDYLGAAYMPGKVCDAAVLQFGCYLHTGTWKEHDTGAYRKLVPVKWPLPNVLVGTSIANQTDADERIPQLLKCPGNKWLSIEPMEGPINLTAIRNGGEIFRPFSCLQRWTDGKTTTGIDWVICGGGPKPMHPAWVRSIRDQCQAAKVPFWFKQWGEWITKMKSKPGEEIFPRYSQAHCWNPEGIPPYPFMRDWAYRVGKKAAGRLLDGREWNELPEAVR